MKRTMPRIPVHLPSLLTHCTQGRSRVEIEADTLNRCLEHLLDRYPLLRVHLFDESGAPRQHVLFFLNEENTRWLKQTDTPLKSGDSLTIVQSVSGG